MSEPISELAFTALIGRFQTITLADGFYTDAGSNVARARRIVTADMAPLVNVWDGGETPTKGGTGNAYSMTMEQLVNVEVHAAADQDDTGLIVGLLKSDVKRAALVKDTFGALASATGQKLATIEYRGADVTTRESGGETESVTLRFALIYQEGFGDPSAVL